jgi:hypothetical protein
MRAFIRLSGLIYALVALVHLLRVLRRWPLLIAGFPLPAIASLLVAGIAGGLAFWAWRLLGAPPASASTSPASPQQNREASP